MNNKKKMYELLDLSIFEDLSHLEEYLELSICYHLNYRYIDIYQSQRNTLFHGKNFLGMDYSMRSCYLHRYININQHYESNIHLSEHFLSNLQQIYIIEQKCHKFNYAFEDILCIYLEYECLTRFMKLFLIFQWSTHPALGSFVKTYLNTWKNTIHTVSLESQEIHFFKSKALSHLNYLTDQYLMDLGLENQQLLLNWFEFFTDSNLLPTYLQIIKFIKKYQNTEKRTIDQMRIFCPQSKDILAYLEQNLQNTIPTLFEEESQNRNAYWTTAKLLDIHQIIIELENLLQMPKYKLLLSVDRKVGFSISRTYQFSYNIKWKKILGTMFRVAIYGGVILGGSFWIQQKSASAMMHESKIVMSMSSKDLPTLGTIGTYSELQRAQRNAKNSISQSYQRSHNLPMKSWDIIEIPKTSTPVILLDPPRHQYLDRNREKFIKDKTVFCDKYLHKLIEDGYIAANGVWTDKGLQIIDNYNLSCDT